MVDEGKVKEVVLNDNYILFTAETENGRTLTFQTGVFPDDGLRERLENAGVSFSSYIESEGSPFISFLIAWILPIIMFSLIGRLLFSALNKRGGNAMSFKKDLASQIQGYILFPENVIDEAIKQNCKSVDLLTEKQMADICAVRRNNLAAAKRFMYSLEDLDLIITAVDRNPQSSFAKLRDAVRQIEFILNDK